MTDTEHTPMKRYDLMNGINARGAADNNQLTDRQKTMKLQQVAMLSTLILAGIAASPVAQADALLVKPGDIKWADSPALPKGGKTALTMGDPKQGPFVQRVKFPANYKYPAHTYPDARTITVLSGTLK